MGHWPTFAEFVTNELASGGPDQQLPFLAYLLRDQDKKEQVWCGGCYGAHHVVLSAWVLWKEFRPEEVAADTTRLEDWLADHWHVLPIRPEMRSHRMLGKRVRCLQDFAKYALGHQRMEAMSYNEVWDDSIKRVKYYNRYMASKVLDIWRRTAYPHLVAPRIEMDGAWSPRMTVSLLFPDEPILAERENKTKAALALAEVYANKVKQQLLDVYGIDIDYFQLQVLLCEYRELLNGTFYNGKSLDEELDYINKNPQFDVRDEFLSARQALFPQWALGELNGWHGERPELLLSFPVYGHIWSDKPEEKS